MNRNDFEAFNYLDDLPIVVNPHKHDFWELLFFSEGHVSYIIEDSEVTLVPGDLLIIPPLSSHYPRFLDAGAYRRNIIWISEEYMKSFEIGEYALQSMTLMVAAKGYGHFKLEPVDRYTLFSRVASLAEEMHCEMLFCEELSKLLLSEVLILLTRFVSPYLTINNADSLRIVNDICAYIESHLEMDITLDSLSETFFISKYHLSRIFKKQMGTSPYNYIIQRRLRHAKDLLDSGANPTEAYKKCGYKNYPSFYRAFIKKYGCQPKDISSSNPTKISTV